MTFRPFGRRRVAVQEARARAALGEGGTPIERVRAVVTASTADRPDVLLTVHLADRQQGALILTAAHRVPRSLAGVLGRLPWSFVTPSMRAPAAIEVATGGVWGSLTTPLVHHGVRVTFVEPMRDDAGDLMGVVTLFQRQAGTVRSRDRSLVRSVARLAIDAVLAEPVELEPIDVEPVVLEPAILAAADAERVDAEPVVDECDPEVESPSEPADDEPWVLAAEPSPVVSPEPETPLAPRTSVSEATVERMRGVADRFGSTLSPVPRASARPATTPSMPFGPRRLVENVVGAIRPSAQAKGLTLAIACDARVPVVVRADADRLQQVLVRLVGRAVNTSSEGTITIGIGIVYAVAESVLLRFTVDHPAVDLPLEFQPFAFELAAIDADEAPVVPELLEARRLVQAMGGAVGLESVPGAASTFWCTVNAEPANESIEPALPPIVVADEPPRVELPVVEPPAAEPPALIETPRAPVAEPVSAAIDPVSPAADPSPLAGVRILLADDSPVNQRVIAAMVGSFGCEVVVVDDGQAAVEAVAREPWHVILMDCQMPRLDGLAATQAIRQAERGRLRVPIVALTAEATDEDRSACVRAGMDDYVTKPARAEVLRAVLERWVASSVEFPVGDRLEDDLVAPPTLDDGRLGEVEVATGAGESDMRDLVALFLRTARETANEARRAIQRRDGAALEAAAHRLMGSARSMGADRLATLCTTLAAFGRDGTLDAARVLVGSLDHEVNAVIAALDGSPDAVSTPVAEPERVVVPLPVPSTPASLEGVRILVADDSPVNQRITAAVVRKFGCAVDVVANGREAVAAAAAGRWSIILMDVQMPELDGIEATRIIRAAEGPGSRVPIVALTANTGCEDRAACLEAGMDDFLAKPVRMDALRAVIERWSGVTREPGPVDEESVDPASRAIVNEAVLDEVASVFAGGDVRKMREIVDLFVLTSRENVSGVRRALRAGDAKTLETVAHRLKGSAATMGAERVAAAAAAVSTHARKNDLPAAQQAAVELDRELNELVSMLRRRRAA